MVFFCFICFLEHKFLHVDEIAQCWTRRLSPIPLDKSKDESLNIPKHILLSWSMPQCVGLCSSHGVARRNAELELILWPDCFRLLWMVVGDFGGCWKSKQGEIAAIIVWDRAQGGYRGSLCCYIERGNSHWYFWYTYTWWRKDISAGILCNPAFKPRHHTTKWFLLGFLGMWLNTGITWGLLQQDSSLPLRLKYGFWYCNSEPYL